MIKNKEIKTTKREKLIFLPRSEFEFDELVKRLVKRFKLPSIEHASAILANRIMHLPPDQAVVTEEYLGHCVIKNIAYQVAQAKGSLIQHKMQIDQIEAELKNNPFNQQALDALEKAAGEGSKLALEVLKKYKPDAPIIPIRPSEIGESQG